MSGSSNNSWTIVTPEETAAETLRPLAEGREGQDELSAPTEDFGAKPSDGADVLPVEDHLKSEEITTNQSEETDYNASVSDLVPASSEVIGSSVPDSQAEDPPVDSALSSTDPESFSDSYTHLSPSPDESLSPCPDESQASSLTAETLGHLDSGQEEEVRGQTDINDKTQHQTTEFQQEPETPQWTYLETPPDSTVESEVVEEKPETTAQETEPEVRRRRSLLAALERIGRTDDEEEAEEDFQLPQREEDTGITLNKCILGAVILLGLGTIFISGVFMDLDEAESDYSSSELKDTEAPGKQEWLNPDVARTAAEADTAELLNKLAKGNEHIAVLQAQLQSQNEELKAAKAQTAEGTERLQQEVVEKENSRLQTDLDILPVLQKELEKMKRELESVTLLQREVETLRSTVTQLKLNTAAAEAPSSGQTEDSSPVLKDQQVQKKDKRDTGERKERKDERSEMKKEKKQRKDGGKMEGKDKEWKKDQSESGQFEKRQKAHKQHKEDKHSKHSGVAREWKKESKKEWERGDEGKPRKDKNEKKEWKDKSDKKSKHDQFKDDKHWKSKEEKRGLKEGKHHKDRYQGDGEKSWKKGGDYHKEESKERKHWKDKDSWESKNSKNNGERKPWSEDNRKNGKDEKKWKKRDDRKQGNSDEEVWKERKKEKKQKEQWREERSDFEKHQHKTSDHKEHTWTEKKPTHSHNKPSPSQPEYWADQRNRIQHSTRSLQSCDTPDTCAQAEGVRPVHFNEFDTILQNYLSKAQTAGVDALQIDELQKLATESFKNGVFVHDQMSFQDYVEDIGDILEDLVEGEDRSGGQDSTIEDEMEGFEREVMQTFALSGSGEQERVKGEWRKENARGRG